MKSAIAFALVLCFFMSASAQEAVQDYHYVLLADWALGDAPFCFHIDCVYSASYVPSGTGYLALHGNFLQDDRTVDIKFPSPVSNVSFVALAKGGVTVIGYDIDGNILAASTINPPLRDGERFASIVEQWPNQSISITATGIDRISIAGDFAVIDVLNFGGVIEDFEGYAAGNNIELWTLPVTRAFLVPGTETDYLFKSGAVLTGPIPNSSPTCTDLGNCIIPEPSSFLLLLGTAFASLGQIRHRQPRSRSTGSF